ncbi:MAG: GAF domain-containing protein [Anaerolineales bacterium]|nr:GAF domain-containing protein [Anaerolineales bacterium]MDW8279100.1 GAF domain-containing protein [Anaerolineales bacterium]
MLDRIVDWLLPQPNLPEEQAANRTWLQIFILCALGAIAGYLILHFRSGLDIQRVTFLVILAVFLLGMLALLQRGYVRLGIAVLSLANLAALLTAAYIFGGVKSDSYFSVVAALVIIAMFLRRWMAFLCTLLAIAFGGLLVWGEMQGWYVPVQETSSALMTWGNASLVFIIVTVLISAASRTARRAFERNQQEIEDRRKAEAALQEQTRYLIALHETALAIINRLEVGPLLQSILQSALELTNTEHGYVDMYLPERHGFMKQASRGIFSRWPTQFLPEDQGITGEVFRRGASVVIEDYPSWPNRVDLYAGHFHAIAAAPMKVRGEVIGIIGLAYTEPGRTFTPNQVKSLEQFAELAALAADNARLYESARQELAERERVQQALSEAHRQLQTNARTLERRSQLLQVAAEVSRAASAILDPATLSQQVVELVQSRFGLYYVGLFLVDERGEDVILRAATGEAGREMMKAGHKFPIGNSSMVGWCVANRRARIALDVGEDAVRFSNPLLPHTRSELALPLISRGQILGALTIQSTQESAFSDEDIETFQTMSDQLANAIQNARLYEQLEQELEERKRAEMQVRQLNAELEDRVERRTLALKASEERFRALADNNPLRIRRYDREGRYLYANAVSDLPNFEPGQIIGKTIREVLADKPELVEFAERCLAQVFETGQPMQTEYQFGEDSYALWYLAPEFGPDGQVISVVTTTLDISERRRMEDELRARTLELQASNRELESFSYSVSHDLRAPLRALDGFSRILLEDFQDALPENARHYLTRIREATQQMSQLIDDMLRLSRISRTELRRDPVNLSELARQILESLQTQEPERNARIMIQEDLSVQGDAGLLRLALENLLGNAWKFTAKSNPTEIEVGKTFVDGKETFFIRDNGVGFDMAYADKLFGVFQRLHNPSEFPGTGVGLAIVQRVIHRHGGRIWAQSAPGQGATFYFTL